MARRILIRARKFLDGLVLLGLVILGVILLRDYILRQLVTDDMVLIPAGEFTMGLTRERYEEMLSWEKSYRNNAPYPARIVMLDDYYIDRNEVTVRDYRYCVSAGICSPFGIWAAKCSIEQYQCTVQEEGYESCKERVVCEDNDYTMVGEEYYKNPVYADYPIIGVTWYQAWRYCDWRGDRLPTEAEWEKAARGTDGRFYPWGNEWIDEAYTGIRSERSLPTGKPIAPEIGASPYGVLNMIGGVREWTSDIYYEYKDPTAPPPYWYKDEVIVRGGFYGANIGREILWGEAATVVHRLIASPRNYASFGFRCVRGEKPPPIDKISTLYIPYREQPAAEPLPLPNDSVVFIPASKFLFGTQKSENYRTNEPIFVQTDAYYITQYEISYNEYAELLTLLGGNAFACYKEYCAPTSIKVSFEESLLFYRERVGAMQATWYGAYAYCQWRGGRLPTEIELEIANLPTRIEIGNFFEREWTGEKYQADYPSNTTTLLNITDVSEFPTILAILRKSDILGRAQDSPLQGANFRCVFPQ